MTDKRSLTPTEIEFQTYMDLLVGAAVIQIAEGHEPAATIKEVVLKVLQWIHEKEKFNG